VVRHQFRTTRSWEECGQRSTTDRAQLVMEMSRNMPVYRTGTSF